LERESFSFSGIVPAVKRLLALVTLAGALALLVAVTALSQGSSAGAGALEVVAAENMWGSIATQLGGDRVHVTSIVANPATDPHDYEPTALDARTLASAQLVIVNGIGYDPWAPKLLAANPVDGRVVVTVGDVVGIRPGDNPHQWYSPQSVVRVVGAISAAYARLDPKDATYFARLRTRFVTHGLAGYRAELATIRRRYHGVRVGASESIFSPLAPALGLDLVTPPSFLTAISEGTEPTPQDLATIERQIAERRIEVWVYNRQNSTPDVQRLTNAARARGIAVTTITETLSPQTATFQSWQVAQLRALQRALARATHR
jgi:zinc/manganese transport system substrate-binding protein